MMSYRCYSRLLVAGALLLAGCGKKKSADGHAHGGEHDHAEAAASVTFKEGRGLQLTPETTKALGVTTTDVADRPIAHRVEFRVSVFQAGPPARANALVSPEIAQALEKHPPKEAKILSVSRTLTVATGQVDVTFELPTTARVGETLPLILTGEPASVTAVPVSAVLRTATGTFVFVANGDSLLRTAVKVGASDGNFVEITDGLYSGDVVAASAVEQLWLTELRLTKGGGHSH